MIRHYYTLKHVESELQCIEGSELIECFTQDKGILLLTFLKGKKDRTLEFSTIPGIDSLYIRRRFARARKNTVELFPNLLYKQIQNIRLIENERIFCFNFGDIEAFFYLFGGAKNNCFVVQAGKIIDSFKDSAKYAGTPFSLPEQRIRSFFDFPDNATVYEALSRCELLLGKHYAEEICTREIIEKEKRLNQLDKEKISSIYNSALELKRECLNSGKYYLYSTENKKDLLSLIKLQKSWDIIEEFKTISEAIQSRIISTIKNKKFSGLYDQLQPKINKELMKIKNKLSHIEDSEKTRERAEKYRKWAELLIAQPKPKEKHGESIDIIDWEGNKIEIKLDPKLNLIQNSEKYFEKAAKSLQSIKERKKLVPQLINRKEKLSEILTKIEKARSFKELEKIKNEISERISPVMIKDKKENETRFRQFDIGDGYTVYAGKNAANNDELTLRFAKPNDLWFHARGAGGSHVLLRLDKGDKPGKHIIERAASIAAYYSQQRKSKLTPVAYTFKKYVRKPKGANPGTVVLSREDVVMIKPRSPEEIVNK